MRVERRYIMEKCNDIHTLIHEMRDLSDEHVCLLLYIQSFECGYNRSWAPRNRIQYTEPLLEIQSDLAREQMCDI